jgi:hypothetical protein
LCKELLDDARVRLLVEGAVKGENWTRALEAVADEVELVHGVQVLAVELDGGTVGGFAHPGIEVLAFTGFEDYMGGSESGSYIGAKSACGIQRTLLQL